MKHNPIPKSFEVQPLFPWEKIEGEATCGYCGLRWDDSRVTSLTPAPAGRCPFEFFHVYSDMTLVEMLALEGNGAVQVDESPEEVPPIVMLAGPIKVWWSEWGSGRHKKYTQWRDAVRVALVKAGCAVYSPHRAIQGRWNERLQNINDSAIKAADHVVILTPPGCPAEGTEREHAYAKEYGIHLVFAPPGNDEDLKKLVRKITGHDL